MRKKNIFKLICLLASIQFATPFSVQAGEPYYYPALSNLIKQNNLPSSINLVDKENIFKDIYYENYFSSGNGNTTSSSLTLVSRHQLKFNLANTDVLFVANPNNNGKLEKIKIERVDYTMKGKKYMYNMPAGEFKYSIRACYDILKRNVTEDQLLYQCEKSVWKPRNERNSYFSQYLEDINEHYKTNIHIDQQKDNYIDELKYQLAKNKIDVFESIYELYIIKPTEAESVEQLNDLFYMFTDHMSADEYVKNLFIATIETNIEALSPNIEFPEKILTPLNHKKKKTSLHFGTGKLDYDITGTETMIKPYCSDSTVFTPSQLGLKKGITLKLSTLDNSNRGKNKIRFEENKNEITIQVGGKNIWEIDCAGKFICRSNSITITQSNKSYKITMENPVFQGEKAEANTVAVKKLTVLDSGKYILETVPVSVK